MSSRHVLRFSLNALLAVAVFVVAPATRLAKAVDTRAIANASGVERSASQAETAQQVRSILSNRCFACHGPDEEERQGGFRLDVRDSFLREADTGEIPVVPGDADASEILRRITSDDEDERMPPPDFGGTLSDSETRMIREWIESGADLPEHWAFVPPQRPAVPATLPNVALPSFVEEHWTRHAVDQFVLNQQFEQGLLAEGFVPSPRASRAELLRRVSLDLVGLPPTVEEVELFEQDVAPGAYEQQVERLLASPKFGEHWARKWLDLARYADSAGYADDPPRTIWAYRDWVIRAVNENMPIDEFTVAQLAGDLLPNPSEDDLVATAFHRNTLTNNEGGTNDEEFRNVAVVDRVNTTMAVWMGVTMACAQCHTHKYDPFTHEEYFQLFAIFNQSQDADRRDESPIVELHSPGQRRDREQWLERRDEVLAALEGSAESLSGELSHWLELHPKPAWQTMTHSATAPMAATATGGYQFAVSETGAIELDPESSKAEQATYTVRIPLEKTPSAADSQESSLHAIRLVTLPKENAPSESPGDSLTKGGAGLAGGNFVVTDVKAYLTGSDAAPRLTKFVRIELPGKERILSLAEVQAFSTGENVALTGVARQSSTAYSGDAKRAVDGNTDGEFETESTTHTATSDDPWWELELSTEVPLDRIVVWNRTDHSLAQRLDGAQIRLLDASRQTVFETSLEKAPKKRKALEIRDRAPVEFVVATADYQQSGFPAEHAIDDDAKTGWAVGGRVGQSHSLTLVPKQPVSFSDDAQLEIEIAQTSTHKRHLLASFRIEVTREPSISEWVKWPAEALPSLAQLASQDMPVADAALLQTFGSRVAASTLPLRSELAELERSLASLTPQTSVPVMRELPAEKQRETFVQIRGNYKSHGVKVHPGTPEVFHSVDRSATQVGRLELANWLVDQDNPLTARVWMNRMWESLFGIGIVRSSEDFGAQGDRPTHPALLDWLAVELMQSGWDNKHMLRLLVHSETYKQTSQVSPAALARDQDNVWLARGPRVRLSAEMVRDQALAIGGLLSQTMYGEPVRPPQPDLGLKAAFGSDTDWTTSSGEDRYRRGVYTNWRRSSPYPSMVTFDAPSREVCTLRRDSTNTPLQALVTLNDPGFFEAAQALARRVVLREHAEASDERRIESAFELCTNRLPEPKELAALARLLDDARQRLSADPSAAKQLATEPLGTLPAGANATELAAFTTLCNVLLNLDEVLMKR